jgi:cyclopropane fatty-acyl-phospholipid synthase-like methyltransferase
MADDAHTPHDTTTTVTGEGAAEAPDWAAYYRHTLGREPRPLFLKGMEAVRAAQVAPGQAVEIGFGDGTETLALLESGWHVLAVDQAHQAEAVLRPRLAEDVIDRLDVRIASAAGLELPPFDLLYAGYALSFLAPHEFRRFWADVRAMLRPGGFVVVNVFGVRDTWAGDAFMTFVDRDTVDRMVAGLEVIAIDEEDADGSSFVGDKHWHVFDIVARRPILR